MITNFVYVCATICFIFLLVKVIIMAIKKSDSFDKEMDELAFISIAQCIVLIFLTVYIIIQCIFAC